MLKDGVFAWPGDWSGSFVKINYKDRSGDPGTEDMSVKVEAPWGFWLPYCPQTGPHVPVINGYHVPTCNVAGYTSITMQLKATVPEQKWSLAVSRTGSSKMTRRSAT